MVKIGQDKCELWLNQNDLRTPVSVFLTRKIEPEGILIFKMFSANPLKTKEVRIITKPRRCRTRPSAPLDYLDEQG